MYYVLNERETIGSVGVGVTNRITNLHRPIQTSVGCSRLHYCLLFAQWVCCVQYGCGKCIYFKAGNIVIAL